MMRCVIIANGEVGEYDRYRELLADCSLLICADGGLRHARVMGLVPGIIVGDMDSVPTAWLDEYSRLGCEILHYPREKDELDSELAIECALARGATEIILLGCTGPRLDHSLAALHLLVPLAQKGVQAVLLGAGHRVGVVTPAMPVCWKCFPGNAFSILPLTMNAAGVSCHGLKWVLQDASLRLGKPFTVSNQVLDEQVRVTVRDGILLVMEIDAEIL